MDVLAPANAAIVNESDVPPESMITDLLAHFTIGASTTENTGKTQQLLKQKHKTTPRLPGDIKRRLPSSYAATQPSTRGVLPMDENAKAVDRIETRYQTLPTNTAFTFESSKTIDFSNPVPSFSRTKSVKAKFTSSPNSFPRAVQSLPPDILVAVIQLTEPGLQLEVLKSLSLVNKALHYAIAPILYRSLSLTSLSQVYDFSLGPRHPLCVVSVQMFLTPDPRRPDWHPSDPQWINGLIDTLFSLERLMSLGIKRCGSNAVAQAIISHSTNVNFLASLQSLSFGVSHQFAALSIGRPIRSCGFAFQVKETRDCDKLKDLLTIITSSGEQLRELQITINMPAMEDRSKVLKIIGECAPSLRRLSVRFQLKGYMPVISFKSRVIAHIVPPLKELTSLELFDTTRFSGEMDSHIAAAIALTGPSGPCPNLQLVNFDGTLWKRTQSTFSSPTTPSAAIAQNKGAGTPKGNKRFPHRFRWTPHPASLRGCNWWADRAHLLKANSQQQAMVLLKHWVLQYWNPEDLWEVEPGALRW